MSPEIAWILAIAFLLVIELVFWVNKKRLLSDAVWDFSRKYPVAARWMMFALGVLAGHFWW